MAYRSTEVNYNHLFKVPTYFAEVEDLDNSKFLYNVFTHFRTQHLPRLNLLNDYYIGKHNILNRTIDNNKPNNKIVSNYPNYITNLFMGYLFGNAVSYSADNIEQLEDIFDNNDESSQNAELAKIASIYGTAYELMYLNENGEIRFKAQTPREIIIIRDTTIEQNVIGAIRYQYYKSDENMNAIYKLSLYTKDSINTYITTNDAKLISVESENVAHYFKQVPIVEYKNNSEMLSDYESIIPLIDSYNVLMSDNTNELEQHANSYLVFKGFQNPDDEELSDMQNNRIIILDSDGEVEYLTKSGAINDSEQLLKRIENDIFTFSNAVNLNDTEFHSSLSGIAIKFKLFATETKASTKERYFKIGLNRRIELINNILALKNNTIVEDVKITFSRNIPSNNVELSQMVSTLQNIVSRQTLLEQLSFVESVDDELAKIESEKETEYLGYDFGGVEDDTIQDKQEK